MATQQLNSDGEVLFFLFPVLEEGQMCVHTPSIVNNNF